MTVRELINELLNCNMDKEVKLWLDEPHDDGFGGTTNGYLFGIDDVCNRSYAEIKFTDWRK